MEVKKTDLTFFKNEVLEDIRKLEHRLNNKINLELNKYNSQVNKNRDSISDNNKKIFEILKSLSNEEEKIKINMTLSSFQTKIDGIKNDQDSKLITLEKQIHDMSFKYDKIFITNLTSIGLIGNGCEFANSRIFFEYTYNKLKELQNAREIQKKNVEMYKKQLESLIDQFKQQINLTEAKFSLYCNDLLKRFEFRNNEKYKEVEDKIINMRADNDKFSSELKKKMEDLDSQWNKMIEFKNDILEKFDKNITEIQTERIDLKKENDLFKSDFKEMKDKFNEMSEFFKNKEIKENRHRSKSIYSKGNSNNFHRFNIQDNNLYLRLLYERNNKFNEDLSPKLYNIKENEYDSNINYASNNEINKQNNNYHENSNKAESDKDKIKINNVEDNIIKNIDKHVSLNNKIDETQIKNKISFYHKIDENQNKNKISLNNIIDENQNKNKISPNDKIEENQIKNNIYPNDKIDKNQIQNKINLDNKIDDIQNKNKIILSNKIEENQIIKNEPNINYKMDKILNNSINATKNITNNELKLGSIIKNIDSIKNKEINEFATLIRENNNNNINKIKSNNIFNPMKNNMNFVKKEILRNEKIKMLKNNKRESSHNDFTYNLINNNNNFVNKLKEEKDIFNKTYNNRFIKNPEISNNNSIFADLANQYLSKTKSKFYSIQNKENNNEIKKILKYNNNKKSKEYNEHRSYSPFGIPEIKIINYNNNNDIDKKNQERYTLNSVKVKHMRNKKEINNKNFLSNDYYFEEEKNKLDNNIIDNNIDYSSISNENEKIENESFLNKNEFYGYINETKKSIKDLNISFDKKINKLAKQIKNLADEFFKYHGFTKLNNKCLLNPIIMKSKSFKNTIPQNSGTDSLTKKTELNGRKINLRFFSEINNNLSFSEEQKANSKKLLEKIDSFLIKKFKE